jgi:hypothetical protein
VCKSGYKGENCDVSLLGELSGEQDGEFAADLSLIFANMKFIGEEFDDEKFASSSATNGESQVSHTEIPLTTNFVFAEKSLNHSATENSTLKPFNTLSTTEEVFTFHPLFTTTSKSNESELNVVTTTEQNLLFISTESTLSHVTTTEFYSQNPNNVLVTSTEKIISTLANSMERQTDKASSSSDVSTIRSTTHEVFTFHPLITTSLKSNETQVNLPLTTEFSSVTYHDTFTEVSSFPISNSSEISSYTNQFSDSMSSGSSSTTIGSVSVTQEFTASPQLTEIFEDSTTVASTDKFSKSTQNSWLTSTATNEEVSAFYTKAANEMSTELYHATDGVIHNSSLSTEKPEIETAVVPSVDDELSDDKVTTENSLNSNEVEDSTELNFKSSTTEKSNHEKENSNEDDESNALVSDNEPTELASPSMNSHFLTSTEPSKDENKMFDDKNFESSATEESEARSDEKFSETDNELLHDRNESNVVDGTRKPRMRNFFYYYFITAIRANESRAREMNKTLEAEAQREHFMGLPGDRSCVEHQFSSVCFYVFVVANREAISRLFTRTNFYGHRKKKLQNYF